jgi:hypothetical protein
MWKTIAIAGATAVVIGGAGTAAMAASGTPAPTASVSPGSSASLTAEDGSATDTNTTQARKRMAVNRLRGAVHASWVSQNKKTGTFTTHEAIRGQVTAVSATSITVKAADSVTETYVLNASTKVHSRATKAAASISDIKTGDRVLVAGTGTTTLTAVRVVEAKKQ